MKYRIWDKEAKCERHEFNLNQQGQVLTLIGVPFVNQEKFVVQRFTGLKDSKGVDIYEGDILDEEIDLDKDDCHVDETSYIRNSAVYFKNGYFNHDEDNHFNLSMNSVDGKNSFVTVVGHVFQEEFPEYQQ